jgi:hypothetical protein
LTAVDARLGYPVENNPRGPRLSFVEEAFSLG